MRIEMIADAAPANDDLDAIERGLVEHAAAAGIEPRDRRPLTVLARDDSGG